MGNANGGGEGGGRAGSRGRRGGSEGHAARTDRRDDEAIALVVPPDQLLRRVRRRTGQRSAKIRHGEGTKGAAHFAGVILQNVPERLEPHGHSRREAQRRRGPRRRRVGAGGGGGTRRCGAVLRAQRANRNGVLGSREGVGSVGVVSDRCATSLPKGFLRSFSEGEPCATSQSQLEGVTVAATSTPTTTPTRHPIC